MKTFSKIIFILTLTLFPILSFAGAAQPQIDPNYGLKETQVALPGANTNVSEAQTQVASFIGTLINAVLGVMGVVFLILTIYAGALWMTAGGNSEQLKKGKTILTWAVLGIIVVFSAYMITSFVLSVVPAAGQ